MIKKQDKTYNTFMPKKWNKIYFEGIGFGLEPTMVEKQIDSLNQPFNQLDQRVWWTNQLQKLNEGI